MSMTTQDMVALRKARALIEDVAPRTAFGRSVNYIEDRWDNGKCLLGVYEASENWDKATTDQYVADACYYLNNLNEHFKVPGYHFDLTGIIEGNLYVAKDREETDLAFNSCDGEYDYMQENAYRQYLANKAEVQHKLNLMVHEATIIVDEESDYASKLGQLMSITEGVSDTVSDAWTKFKNFLAKIWAKFTEFISRTFNSDKNYLTKYKDIILNKPYQLENATIDDDYFTGIQRLSTYQVTTPQANDINAITATDDEAARKQMQQLVVKSFKNMSYNGNIDFSDYCKSYFKGARDPNVATANKFDIGKDNINMTTVFNFCYNYDKLSNNLNKNRAVMEKAGESFIALAKELNEKKPEETRKTSNDTVQGGTGASTVQGGQGTTPTANNQNQTKPLSTKIDDNKIPKKEVNSNGVKVMVMDQDEKRKIQDNISKYNRMPPGQSKIDFYNANIKPFVTESVFTPYLGLVLEEFTVGKSSGAGGTNTSKSNVKPDANKFGNIAANNTIAQQKGVGGTIKDADLDKEADGLIKKTNLYTNTCGTVFAGMCTAAQTIHRDFMKLIKAHVSSYLGDKETPDQAARSAASYGGFTPDENTIPKLQQRINDINKITDKESPQGKEQINQILNAAAADVNNSRTFASAEDIQGYIDSIKPQQQPAQG